MKEKINKPFSLILIAFESIIILSTIINVIYCLSTLTTALFPFSMFTFIVPVFYIINGFSYFNLLVLIPFLIITLVLFTKNIKALLKPTYPNNKIIPINIIWFLSAGVLSNVTFFNFYHFSEVEEFVSLWKLIIWLIFGAIGIIVVFSRFNFSEKSKAVKHKEKEIKQYTKYSCLISFFTIFISLWFHYFTFSSLSNPYHINNITIDLCLLIISLIVQIAILIVNNIDFKQNCITKGNVSFIVKINVIELISVAINLVYFLVIIIL